MKSSPTAAISLAFLAAAATTSTGSAFVVSPHIRPSFSTTATRTPWCKKITTTTAPVCSLFVLQLSSSSEKTTAQNNNNDAAAGTEEEDPLGLTPELRRLTDAFQNIGDDKLRYKQLLYMASNGLEAMPEELKTEDNKVLGCLSTVHVHATTTTSDEQKTLIHFTGDSDGLLTKGLVALLVRGLSGNTAEAIQKVNPQFIQTAGISQSLTPGRNNGFLNMLALMKRKAAEAASSSSGSSSDSDDDATSTTTTTADDGNNDRPMYHAIVTTLQTLLKPTKLELIDNSHQHAGHAGNTGNGSESHFQLTVVADAFEGLNLVKRHKLIYMMLGDVMPKIHALQIQAMTPDEAANKKE